MLNDYLRHHGVLGMKWGIRKTPEQLGKRKPSRTSGRQIKWGIHKKSDSNDGSIISKNGESVELHRDATPVTAIFLGKLIPSIKKNQFSYSDYTIRSKDGKAVGNMALHKESESSINLVWIGINTKNEGKGYGSSAMRTIIDAAKKDRKIKQITLEVPTNSPNARHIYEKYGFKATGEKMLGIEDDVWGGLTKMKLEDRR